MFVLFQPVQQSIHHLMLLVRQVRILTRVFLNVKKTRPSLFGALGRRGRLFAIARHDRVFEDLGTGRVSRLFVTRWRVPATPRCTCGNRNLALRVGGGGGAVANLEFRKPDLDKQSFGHTALDTSGKWRTSSIFVSCLLNTTWAP